MREIEGKLGEMKGLVHSVKYCTEVKKDDDRSRAHLLQYLGFW